MSFNKSKIICIGDLILDIYGFGGVEKISPEAPIPVLKILNEKYVLGGAGNVARNICTGGGKCHLISVSGNDNNKKRLEKLIKENKNLSLDLIVDEKRVTTSKKRYVSGHQQVLRVDRENVNYIDQKIENRIIKIFSKIISKFNIVVLSDYNKGLLKPSLVQKIIEISKENKKFLIVDPKRDFFSLYKGADIITPNYKELVDSNKEYFCKEKTEEENIKYISKKMIDKYSFDTVITTRSSKGMLIVKKNTRPLSLSSLALEVFDVSGAGDTVVAYLALSLSTGKNLNQSAEIANKAAGISVGKFGTATVSYAELDKNINKIKSINEVKNFLYGADKKKNIGFTNGCFDVLHYGHIEFLKNAKKNCDFLILGLNSDKSVKKIKGNKRPIVNEIDRANVLSNFPFVDMIIFFDDETPLKLIKKIKPNFLFKGKDYNPEEVVGATQLKQWGGELKLIDYIKGYSTTNLIKKIKNES